MKVILLLLVLVTNTFGAKVRCETAIASTLSCSAIGATYGFNSCGFDGCCVNPGAQMMRFDAQCRQRTGYGIQFRGECSSCN